MNKLLRTSPCTTSDPNGDITTDRQHLFLGLSLLASRGALLSLYCSSLTIGGIRIEDKGCCIVSSYTLLGITTPRFHNLQFMDILISSTSRTAVVAPKRRIHRHTSRFSNTTFLYALEPPVHHSPHLKIILSETSFGQDLRLQFSSFEIVVASFRSQKKSRYYCVSVMQLAIS